jgi:hypothetical protein
MQIAKCKMQIEKDIAPGFRGPQVFILQFAICILQFAILTAPPT